MAEQAKPDGEGTHLTALELYLMSAGVAERIVTDTYAEARVLLQGAVSISRREEAGNVTDANIETILQLMRDGAKADSPLREAQITQNNRDALSVLVNNYPTGTVGKNPIDGQDRGNLYNVWISLEDTRWFIHFEKVLAKGNLPSDTL